MTVAEYIKIEENRYQVMPIPVVSGYEWLMFEHVRLTTLYLNSQYKTGKPVDKPFRNIILPKVNLEHRSVSFDLDEIQFYINNLDESYKSFLVKKFHDRWALKNDLADFLDKMSETYTDYGGVLVKNFNNLANDMPEVVPFQRLAFCDQTDMMAGPICEKHEYSPDQLLEMKSKGWGDLAHGATGTIEEVITLSQQEKTNTQTQGGAGITTQPKAKTPGRYSEIYELHGMLPQNFLDPENGDPNVYTRQMHIVTFYTPHEGADKKPITLFAGKEKENLYKAFRRDEIYGRALGRGAVEELFEPQVWVNFSEIAKTEMLEQLSKVIYQTADSSFKARNGTADLENGDVLTYKEGSPLSLLNNQAINLTAFEEAVKSWDDQAAQIASAQGSITGQDQPANTPNELGLQQNLEAHSLHEYRKGRLSIFVTQIYRDWIIPKVLKAISSGDEFLTDLSTDEMTKLVDDVVTNEFNESKIAKVLKGEIVYPDEAQAAEQAYRQQFFKNNKKFITILEGEMKDLPLECEVNITGKQRSMQMLAQKVSQVFTQAVNALAANPNFFTEQPQMAKLFNEILESYGLSSLTFGIDGNKVPPKQVQQPTLTPQLTPQPNGNQQPQPQPV